MARTGSSPPGHGAQSSARIGNPRIYDLLFPSGATGGAGPIPPEGVADLQADLRRSLDTRDPIDGESELEQQCRRLLALLQKHCPDLIPPGPVPSGEVTPPVDVATEQLTQLLRSVTGADDVAGRNQVVWEQAGSELLVHHRQTRVAVLEGLVLVGITVETRETGRVEVTVPFAVGRPDRLAGMVVTTEPAPRGPTVIIDRWGEAIIAHCWRLLMDVVSTLCARVGVDTGGRPLLPGAIVASRGGLRVIPQASHAFEAARR